MLFTAYGHPNILSTHTKTLEFTKDTELTLKGDCIIGVKADYKLEELLPLLKKDKIKMTIRIGDETIIITGKPNPDFTSAHEMVLRRTEFLSDRTLATRCDKAAIDLVKSVQILKNPSLKMLVEIE
jgi:hypothetical protein